MPKILISVILIGLSLFLGIVFLWPKYQELNNLEEEITNIDLDIQYQDEYYKQLAITSERLNEHQAGLTKIDSALPYNPPEISLLKFLQDKASENGLIPSRLSELSVKPLPERSDIKEIQVSLELFGSYPALKNFLIALEKSSRLIEIEAISISTLAALPAPGKTEAKPSDIFSFELTIKTQSY